MENNYAVIKNNKVENIVVWDGESDFYLSQELILIPEGSFVDIGFEYINEEFINPNPPITEQTE